MSAQHTPAPWLVDDSENDRICVRAEDGQLIADCTDGFFNDEGDWAMAADSAPNARLIAAAPTGLACAESMYLELLKHPHDLWRTHNQRLFCELRDYIALATGRSAEDVQNDFEARAA